MNKKRFSSYIIIVFALFLISYFLFFLHRDPIDDSSGKKLNNKLKLPEIEKLYLTNRYKKDVFLDYLKQVQEQSKGIFDIEENANQIVITGQKGKKIEFLDIFYSDADQDNKSDIITLKVKNNEVDIPNEILFNILEDGISKLEK